MESLNLHFIMLTFLSHFINKIFATLIIINNYLSVKEVCRCSYQAKNLTDGNILGGVNIL